MKFFKSYFSKKLTGIIVALMLSLSGLVGLIGGAIEASIGPVSPAQAVSASTVVPVWATSVADAGAGFKAISCPTLSFCAAGDASGNIAVYNGAGWTPTSVSPTNEIMAISCTSASFCMAVDSNGDAYAYNGTNWTTLTTWTNPLLSAGDYFTGVSCPSVTFCVGAASSGNLYEYNGKVWLTATTGANASPWASQNPVDPGVTAISCPTTTMCATDDSGGKGAILTGTTWSAPAAIGSASSFGLGSISCPTTTMCGATDGAGNVYGYSGSWGAYISNPIIGHAAYISCPTSSDCVAVGGGYESNFNGSTWSNPNTGVNIDGSNYLEAVSCASVSFCVAVDDVGNALTYSGEVSNFVSGGVGSYASPATSVSCSAYNYCPVVSTGGTSSVLSPTPLDYSGIGGISVNSVSCISTPYCAAVTNGNGSTSAYSYYWTTGTAAHLPTVTVPSGDNMESVGCEPGTGLNCVGFDNQGDWYWYNGFPPGGTWTEGTHQPGGGVGQKTVSCTSDAFCMAGDSSNFGRTWETSGAISASTSTWTQVSTGTTGTFPYVSCVSFNFCAAVSLSGEAVIWNGATWGTGTAPNSWTNPIDGSNAFASVSCSSTTSCEAVDTSGNAFFYNGTTWAGPTKLDSSGAPVSLSCPNDGSQYCLGVDSASTGNEFLTYNGAPSVTPSVSPVSTTYGGSVTYSATVAGTTDTAAIIASLGETAPAGTVTFSSGGTTLCTTAALSAGFGSCNATNAPVGSNESIVATYSGDPYYLGAVGVTTLSVSPPTVTSLSPTSGPMGAGTSVVINGTGFTGTTGVAGVKFGANDAVSYTVNSSTKITAIAPASTIVGPIDVTVTNAGVTSAASSADQYTYLAPPLNNPPPSVTAVSPNSGSMSGGTSVTITGTGLSGAKFVDFGPSQAASFTVVSSTEITATSPSESAGTVDVQVVGPYGSSTVSAGDKFTFVGSPPVVTGLSPASGPIAGGTSVAITGTGFTGATAVAFGSIEATSFTVNSPTSITAASPTTTTSGPVDVEVTTPSGISATSTLDKFTYSTGLLSINSSGLSAAMAGSSYSATLSASGGIAPYVWSIASGSLPAGLTLSSGGVISGTPSNAGTSSFTVSVSDSSQPPLVATKALTISVASSTPPTTTPTTTPPITPPTTVPPTTPRPGYIVNNPAGGVATYGSVGNDGSLVSKGITPAAPIVGNALAPNGQGYWLVGSDGGVFAFGGAGFYGSMSGKPLSAPVVAITSTPNGQGYWLVGSDGGVFSFGAASFYGSNADHSSQSGSPSPTVAIASTPSGTGYWLVSANGAVSSFGSAGIFGGAENLTLRAPIISIVSTPDGKGYWLIGVDGGVFSYGDAPFDGSAVGGVG